MSAREASVVSAYSTAGLRSAGRTSNSFQESGSRRAGAKIRQRPAAGSQRPTSILQGGCLTRTYRWETWYRRRRHSWARPGTYCSWHYSQQLQARRIQTCCGHRGGRLPEPSRHQSSRCRTAHGQPWSKGCTVAGLGTRRWGYSISADGCQQRSRLRCPRHREYPGPRSSRG